MSDGDTGDLCIGVLCDVSEACHEPGVCDSRTGKCVHEVSPDGESCEDGIDCTLSDICVGGCCVSAGSVDQSVLPTDGYAFLLPSAIYGQTFTVGFDGLLVGVEVLALGFKPYAPMGRISLEVRDEVDGLLGTSSILIESLPSGAAYSLDNEVYGPGFFDLGKYCIHVNSGQLLRFYLDLVDVPAGFCNTEKMRCTSGRVGDFCTSNWECSFDVGIGTALGDKYAGGTALVNGDEVLDMDLQFKSVMQ